jgi:hypothetical protein
MATSNKLIFLWLLSFVLAGPMVHGQQPHPTVAVLSATEINALFTDSTRKEFKLNIPISQVYKYTDRSGAYLCVLMESNDSIGLTDGKTDTFSRNIKAVDLRIGGNTLTKVWELNDHILKDQGEYAIWFWKGYFSFEDYDGDGLVDPFLVYGTWGEYGYDDGRIKFIIYLKGKKYAMRHQSNSLDDGRSTEFDGGYDALPKKLKTEMNSKIARIQKDDHGYFYPLP